LRGFSWISGVELPVPDYGKLEEVINQVLEEMGCQKVKHSVAKCISIYETWITWMTWIHMIEQFFGDG
jgi:phage baseplate assembly protein W